MVLPFIYYHYGSLIVTLCKEKTPVLRESFHSSRSLYCFQIQSITLGIGLFRHSSGQAFHYTSMMRINYVVKSFHFTSIHITRHRPTFPHLFRQVSSAQMSLTTEFGMESGVTSSLETPGNVN